MLPAPTLVIATRAPTAARKAGLYAAMIGQNDSMVPAGLSWSIRSRNLPGLTATSIAALVAAGQTRTSAANMVSIHHFHGAASRIPVTSTPFGQRHDHLMVEVVAAWRPDNDGTPHRAWADDLDAALAQDALPGGYPNLFGPEATSQAARAYGPNTTRLLAAKAHYDPDHVFSATGLPSSTP